jgi:putative Holliday junction resolvase
MVKEPGVILGLDYGNARIGVAVANNLLRIPHPLTTLSTGGKMRLRIEEITPLVLKWRPKLLLVGVPQANTTDASKVQLINTIKNFALRLQLKFNLPVELINEDFSSSNAKAWLEEQLIYGTKQRGKLDQLAACAILQTYFSHNL